MFSEHFVFILRVYARTCYNHRTIFWDIDNLGGQHESHIGVSSLFHDPLVICFFFNQRVWRMGEFLERHCLNGSLVFLWMTTPKFCLHFETLHRIHTNIPHKLSFPFLVFWLLRLRFIGVNNNPENLSPKIVRLLLRGSPSYEISGIAAEKCCLKEATKRSPKEEPSTSFQSHELKSWNL